MSITVTPINTATDTFATWVTQTNTVIDIISSNTLTVDATVGGSTTSGNAALTGDLSVSGNTVVVNLRGGSLATPGAFSITTNVTASANLTVSGAQFAVTGVSRLNGGGIVTNGTLNVGVDGSTRGILSLFGTATATGGIARYYVPADDDTLFEYWEVGSDGDGNYMVTREGVHTPLSIANSTGVVTLANGATITAGGLTVTAGVTDLGANLDLGLSNRAIFDDDNDTSIYATSDDVLLVEVGAGTRLQVNTTVADFQETVIRTGGDIIVDDDANAIRMGVGTTNTVITESDITLANSTVSFAVTKPTADQVTDANYYLASDGAWKIAGGVRALTQADTAATATEIHNFLKADYRSAEITASVRNRNANGFQVSKCLVIHAGDNTNADYNEYSVISTNNPLGTLSANSNTTHVRVFWTNDAAIGNTEIRSSIDTYAV